MKTGIEKPLVVVSGSSGLIGQRVIQELQENYTIAGLDIQPPQDPSGQTWFECDFTQDASVRHSLDEVRSKLGEYIASVVHLAAYYDFAGEPSPLYNELTVQGTKRLLDELQKFSSVRQFVFSSSLLVMKPCELGEKITEASPTQAEWAYPESKLAAEQLIRDSASNIPTVVLRLAGVYDEHGHSLPITQNIRRIAEQEIESYFFPGDADRGQAFTHLDDVVSCIEQTIDKRDQLGEYEVFLVAEDECLSYARLQDIIGERLHGVEDWPTLQIPKMVAKAGAWAKDEMASSEQERPFIKPWMVDLADAHYPVDNSRARRLLDWTPQHFLSETIPSMIENLKRNPQQWYEGNGLPLPDEHVLEELKV